MANTWCTRVVLFLIIARFQAMIKMCRGNEDNNPWESNKLLIGKSWGLPLELKCEDIESPRIKVSGITLARKANTVTAENEYPGIEIKAQKNCDQTLRMPTGSRPAGCTIDLPELGVPNDVMVITVFWCYSKAASYEAAPTNRIASSKSGDVTIKCNSRDLISIQDIQLDNERVSDFNLLKKRCLDEMMKSILPLNKKRNKPEWASCSIKRKGRQGDLKVNYRCDSPPAHAHRVSEPQPPMYPMPPS